MGSDSQELHARIVKAEVFLHELAVRRIRRHGSGDVAGSIRNVFLRLEDEGGRVGWGEAAPWPVFTGTAEAAAAALERHLLPHLMGRASSDAAAILDDVRRGLVGHPEAKAAIDSALLDLAGKQVGVPAWMLLGGRFSPVLPLSVSLADPEVEADLDWMEELLSEGVRIFKIKTGFLGHADELVRLERLASAAAGRARLRVDYNQGMDCFDARRRLSDLDAFGFDFIEQPLPARHVEALAELRRSLRTPLLLDESIFDLTDLQRVIGLRAADAVSIKIMKCGGPRSGRNLSEAARAAGLACYGGDMFETGIAHAAGAHMICASGGFSLGCEFYHSTYHLERDLLVEPFWVSDGAVHVPDSFGLGIEVDAERMRAEALLATGIAVGGG